MAITLEQLAQQEQLHYQVIKQSIDSLYLNLNSSNNSQTSVIVNNLNNLANRIGGETYTQASRVITAVTARANAIEQETLLTVRGLFDAQGQKLDAVQRDLQKKLDVEQSTILGEINKQTNTLIGNIKNSVDNLFTHVTALDKQKTDLLLSIEANLTARVKEARDAANRDANSLLSAINGSIAQNNDLILTDIRDAVKSSNSTLSSMNSLFSSNPLLNSDIFNGGGSGSGSDGSNGISMYLLNLLTGGLGSGAGSLTGGLPIGTALQDQINMISTIIENTSKGQYKTLDQFYTAFRAIGVDTTLISGLLQLIFIIPSLLNIGKQLTGAFDVQIQRLIREQYDLNELETNEVITLFKRHFIDEKDARDRLNKLGVSFKDSDLLLASSFNIYSPQELFRLHSMGILSDEQVEKGYLSLGYRQQDFKNLNQLYRARPAVQDIISFAVKEVFSADTVKKFGQNEDFPEPFKQQAALLGLSEEYAKMYWAAHWQLPSATMGYDMFHRGLINKDELKLLLKSLDVMPFWREKLVELSYNVVGRIDVRRLYAYGIWDKTKVYQQYLKEGYSPEDARDLTTFTIKYDDEQDNKHKTALQKKAHDVYIKAYLSNLIDKQTCINKIVALGYKQQDIELELSLEDYEDYVTKHKPKLENHTAKLIALSNDGYRKRALSRGEFVNNLTQNGYTVAEANTEADYIDKEQAIVFKETVVKEIQKLYFDSLIDDNGVLTKLMALGFANQEALNVIYQLQILKSLDDKKPSQVQFEKMYKLGIVSKEEYYKALGDMGYNDKYIPHLILLAEESK